MIESGFWFLLGFFVASWLAYRARERARVKLQDSFQAIRSGLVDLINSVKDANDIKITIIDRNGELELETEEEDPPAAPSSRPPKSFH